MRKIIHCDCDCFYAAVEMRDHPQWRGRPLAVGGRGRRGVLTTCNYEARRFGIRSAMATSIALQQCPHLLVVPPRFAQYKQASQQIHEIFQRYTQEIEPLSLDEAYLDVSECRMFSGSATRIAESIRRQVKKEVGIVVSAGVAPNKFLAKIASDWQKPDGLFVITPEQVDAFVRQLTVEKLHGVGSVTARKLKEQGLHTCADIRLRKEPDMVKAFGKFGKHLYLLAHGTDDRPVRTQRERKSLSVERTFSDDLPGLDSVQDAIKGLLDELKQRIQRYQSSLSVPCKMTGLVVKLKFNDFTQTTAEKSGEIKLDDLSSPLYIQLIAEAFQRGRRPVRLVGLGVRFKPTSAALGEQLRLPGV